MENTGPNFQQLFETAPDLFIVLKTDFTIAAASDAYLNVAKVPREKILGKNFFEAFPTLDDEVKFLIKETFEKVIRTKTPITIPPRKFNFARSEAEGGGHHVMYWGSINTPVLSSTGEVDYIIRRAEDLTRFVNQEIDQKAAEQERDLFFTHSFDLMALVGTDGYFKKVNPACLKALGYTEEELYSRPLIEFLHPEDVNKTKQGIQILTSGAPRRESVNRYFCKDGTYRWFSWNTTPMGSLLCAVGRDITDEIKADELIKNLNYELEKKNEDLEAKIAERITELKKSEAQILQLQKMDAIGRLAGGIAHDFNNMLGAISIFCDLLVENLNKPEVAKEHIQEIIKATNKGAALTRQLLVFSRKQIIQLQNINLNPLIQHMEKMLARLIGENIRIITKLGSDLKEVSVDPSQIEQVLLNLVVNAKDAMPDGGAITIKTTNTYLDEEFTSTHLSVKKGHYVLLSVTDEGCGMDAETMEKIFEPFYTTKPVGKGTGLGLTTIYGIIKQYNGTIWVYSEVGQGSVFKIYLPVCEKAEEIPEVIITKPQEFSGNHTILLVEDDEDLRTGFTIMLQTKGYKVLAARTALEALELCELHKGEIHLLLTDMVMPGMNGIELAKRAQAIRKNLSVLYMSGYTSDVLDNADIDESSKLNFLQKPFDTKALITKVQEVLAQRS